MVFIEEFAVEFIVSLEFESFEVLLVYEELSLELISCDFSVWFPDALFGF